MRIVIVEEFTEDIIIDYDLVERINDNEKLDLSDREKDILFMGEYLAVLRSKGDTIHYEGVDYIVTKNPKLDASDDEVIIFCEKVTKKHSKGKYKSK